MHRYFKLGFENLRKRKLSLVVVFNCVMAVVSLLFLPCDAVGWSVVCDCGISWSQSHTHG